MFGLRRRRLSLLPLLWITILRGRADDGGEDAFPFTECDHVFDVSKPKGHFSFPIIPQTQNSKYPLPTADFLPANTQCIYTFVAGRGQRVKLEFTQFQLSGTIDNCEVEYVDVYSELESPEQDLLSAPMASRFCGTVAPHVRVSLYNVIVLVFHSRVGSKRTEKFRLNGRYQFINESRYIPGSRLGESACGFLVEPTRQRRGQIFSPTYPGAYPSNFYCFYLLKGNPGDRIRLFFRDFDIYFGGEHCPYDALTVYDGSTNRDPIIRKVCGLQQRLELFSFGPNLLLEFNTTDPAKSEPRGQVQHLISNQTSHSFSFVIDYEFSSAFVDIKRLIAGQKGVSHLRGSECDVRVQSNRESVHFIQSPAHPEMYPVNTTCTYVLDGLQGDQNLEKVILKFESFAILNDPLVTVAPLSSSQQMSEGDECYSFVGVATQQSSIRAVLANNEESFYDATLCDRFARDSPRLGPYTSQGPRMVVVFGSVVNQPMAAGELGPWGFRARVEFKTDFGVPGIPMGGSNECLFKFVEKTGSFNSPRYPANYPLDSNCTYIIQGEEGEQVLLYFEQFALYEEESTDVCEDWLEIYDVFYDANGTQTAKLQAHHCWKIQPGPTISIFGSHEMRVVFYSNQQGTANGFNALYEIRKAFQEVVPKIEGSDPTHCGREINAGPDHTSGWFSSPGYPVKYSQNQICDWQLNARPGSQILLQLSFMDVEGEMTETKTSCKNAVIRIHQDYANRTADTNICGTNYALITPVISINSSIRVSFHTAPDKVNGLRGFNFTWTEVRIVKRDSECAEGSEYLCSYSRLCIDAKLRCNGDDNCGYNDDTDEAHCNIAEAQSDMRTITFAAIFSGFICFFILMFFCVLFKKKFEAWLSRKKSKNQPTENGASTKDTRPSSKHPPPKKEEARRQRQPFRQQQPIAQKHSKSVESGLLPTPATSRLLHHHKEISPSLRVKNQIDENTFYG